MTRLINAVLITVFAFFAVLGVVWQVQGGGTGAGPRGAPSVTGITPSWDRAALASPTPASRILLNMTLHNPAPDAARPASISYEADVDGQTMDRAEGRALTGAPIPARGDGTVAAAVTLPKDFATTWWAASMQGDETTTLRIHGTLSLRRSDGPHDVPFEWRSTWSGTLAKSLSAAVANCSGSGDLCLEQSQFTWAAGRLQAVLVLRNPTPQAVAVGNASVALRLSDHAVVAGNVDLARTIQPGSDAAVSLDLGVQPPGVQAWWPGHVARCETTPVSFAVSLQERPSGSKGVTTLQWTFPAPAFRTRFVCA